MNANESALIDEFIRVRADGGGVVLEVAMVRWRGSHEAYLDELASASSTAWYFSEYCGRAGLIVTYSAAGAPGGAGWEAQPSAPPMLLPRET